MRFGYLACFLFPRIFFFFFYFFFWRSLVFGHRSTWGYSYIKEGFLCSFLCILLRCKYNFREVFCHLHNI